MQTLAKHWDIKPRISPEIDRALNDYHPVLRQILANRGYLEPDAAYRFLQAFPPPGTEPANLAGMEVAVSRMLWALEEEQPIVIYGDYDVDGISATALLVQTLVSLGASVRHYIPDRFKEGYGLNADAIRHLQSQGVALIVTVDCGIRSFEEADLARKLGIDLIISDHHQPGSELPMAHAIINPKQSIDGYPEKNLAGVGLAYKLASGLLGATPSANLTPDKLLDLVALGTVADLVPLVGENRALVREGLRQIQRPRRQGLMALMGVAGVIPARVRAMDIGFILGPRLNAPGRLSNAETAYRLLLSGDVSESAILAQQLDNQNRERQKITREIQTHAENQALATDPDGLLLFAADSSYNPGVVGLAASKLANKYYRPAIVAFQGKTFTRGSCRSIPEFHITKALEDCADLLTQYGGHEAAAGFTVLNKDVPQLVNRLRNIASKQLGNLTLRVSISADLEIALTDLRPELLGILDQIQPTGVGNEEVRFVSRDLRVVRSRTVGRDSAHLKMVVSDGRTSFDAIAFRQGDWYRSLPKNIDLLYTFETNEYNGRTSLQLNVKDIKMTESGLAH